MVSSQKPTFAAEIYKSFLHCAAKIVLAEGGTVTAYDGDRIMAVFTGDSPNTSAARAGLKINHSAFHIINPAVKAQYPESTFQLKHVVGIDRSSLFVAKTGVRGANDLVWVGRAANYAAKLATLPPTHATTITKEVYDLLHESLRTTNGKSMWEAFIWNKMGDLSIYRSTWTWPI
jgi:class 3 adenylate cyclase